MPRKRHKSRSSRPVPEALKTGSKKTLAGVTLGVVLLMALAAVAHLAFFPDNELAVTSTSPTVPPTALPKVRRSAEALDDVLKMPPEKLGNVDIAEMNLLCATGLPGAEKLDINRCLARLDEWASRVERETERHLYKFRQTPIEYYNSPGYFRMLMLVTVLQQDLGVHYNLERVRNIDFTKSQDLFIHGMIGSDNGGTCVSMPVLYTAIARRLRYPVKLVLAKEHVFCRWDGLGEKVNVEGASRGMHSFDDEYYKTWPHPISEAEMKAGYFLNSLSPAEEVASFLASRGHCLLDNGRTEEAQIAYAAAHRLAPKDPAYFAWMWQTQGQLLPPAFARIGPGGIPEPPLVYRHDPLAEANRIDAINRANMQRLTQPPVPRQPGASEPPSPYGRAPGFPQPYRRPVPGQVPR